MIELINGYCSETWTKCFTCCRRKVIHHPKAFSNNIYEELDGFDLRTEYKKTKNEVEITSLMMERGLLKKDPKTLNFLTKMTEKRQYLRVLLMKKLKDLGVQGANDTMDGFYQLLSHTKHNHSHRLRSLYSYDIQENPKYKRSRKGEKRVREYLHR